MSNLHLKIMATDIKAINATLSAHGVNAGIPARTREVAISNSMVALPSHCAYRLAFGPGEQFARVERLRREIHATVATERMKVGFPGGFALRLAFEPLPIVEIDSPVVEPLKIPSAFDLPPFAGAFGEMFDFGRRTTDNVNLTRHHQTLIAAQSQHGKSTAMRSVLASMLENTGPDQVRVFLIDLKNLDLVPFRHLPHVITYAGEIEDAIRAIEMVDQIKARRIASLNNFPFRVLLVIDELAEMDDGRNESKLGSVRHRLASIMKTGAALGINVLAATQNPTAREIGASVARAFTERWIGRVGSKSTATFIAQRSGSGAENLKRKGSFVHIGDNMERVQAYYSEIDYTRAWCVRIARKWSGHPVAPVDISSTHAPRKRAPVARDETDMLADRLAEIRAEADGPMSLGAQCMALLGKPYAGSYTHKLKRIIARLDEREIAPTTTGANSLPASSPPLVGSEFAPVVGGLVGAAVGVSVGT